MIEDGPQGSMQDMFLGQRSGAFSDEVDVASVPEIPTSMAIFNRLTEIPVIGGPVLVGAVIAAVISYVREGRRQKI